MPLLGEDFLPSRPTDGEYVRRQTGRQAATDIRDVKSRMSDFFGVAFDLDSGDLQADVVPSPALKSLTPDPTGTYRRMTVNRKGLVTGGAADPASTPPRFFRAFFFGTSAIPSTVDEEDGRAVVVGEPTFSPGPDFVRSSNYSASLTTAQFSFLQYFFTVPDGVARVDYVITGGSPFVSADGSWSNDPHLTRFGSMRVSPGSVVRVFAGLDSVSPSRVSSYDKSVYYDNTQAQAGVSESFKLLAGAWSPAFGGVGGNPSLVTLEWYA